MALATKAELLASALDWMKRAGQTGQAPDWLTLAEARLNRELGPVETDASRTGTVDSRSISISALSIVEPIALWVTLDTDDEREVQPTSPSNLAYIETSGPPAQWCMDSTTNLKLDRPCDAEYAFRFRYRQRFSLDADGDTNWLLDNHPDIYLAAVLMWGAGYNAAWNNGSIWKGVLDEGIPSVRNSLAQQRRGTLRVDPALQAVGRRTRLELIANG
jgi:hypothetical protein